MNCHQLLLVAAIFLGWLPTIFLWLDPPPLMGDEAYYARVPAEMRERGDWIVPYFNGEPRYKKPPLMYWFVALSQAVFGENEFASRLPSFIAVVSVGLLLAWFGVKVGAAETGLWAAVAFLLNPITAVLGNWGAPEATLCLFVTASVLFGLIGLFNGMTLRWLSLSGIAAGLGVLTKGAPGLVLPIAVILPLAVWKGLEGQREKRKWTEGRKVILQIGLWLIVCLIVVAPWFIAIWFREGEKFWQVFLFREHIQRIAEPMEGHRGPIWFYLPVIWLLFMPWSVFLPHAFANATKTFRQFLAFNPQLDFTIAWWAFSVVMMFSLVATKLPHYIFPAFPALAWLVASQLQRSLSRSEFWLVLLLGLLPIPLIVYSASTASEAYMNFLRKAGFSAGVELKAMEFAAYFSLLGFASVPTIWLLLVYSVSKKALAASGVFLTLASLFVVYTLAHASGGHSAVRFWTKSQNIATFGSDTEWTVFYAKRPVLMLGRGQDRLRNFLMDHTNAAILARVDFAPYLKHEGLILQRFGIWCVASQSRKGN